MPENMGPQNSCESSKTRLLCVCMCEERKRRKLHCLVCECVRARLDDGERDCGPQWAELHACSERILAARRAARRG